MKLDHPKSPPRNWRLRGARWESHRLAFPASHRGGSGHSRRTLLRNRVLERCRRQHAWCGRSSDRAAVSGSPFWKPNRRSVTLEHVVLVSSAEISSSLCCNLLLSCSGGPSVRTMKLSSELDFCRCQLQVCDALQTRPLAIASARK